MFQKLVAIEPVSLVPSAEKALYSFAGQVVMYPDIPANDDEIHWNVLFTLFSRKCQCRYSLC